LSTSFTVFPVTKHLSDLFQNFFIGKGRNKDKCMFLLYVYANSVVNTKGNKSCDNSGLAMEFTMKELYAIEEIQSEENLFRLLVG
jgi:DNA helicase MCM8